MRSFGLNCLFYFCIDYVLHFSRGVQIITGGATFSEGVQISLRGVRTPTKSGHAPQDYSVEELYCKKTSSIDYNLKPFMKVALSTNSVIMNGNT